jgi:hypothetical protein
MQQAQKLLGLDISGVFKSTFGKWDFDLNSFYKGPRYTFNYYGSGNETELHGYPRSFFRVKANNFYISPGISRTWKCNYLRFGLQYETVKILTSQDKFVITPQAKLDSNIFSQTIMQVLTVNGISLMQGMRNILRRDFISIQAFPTRIILVTQIEISSR